MAAQPLIIESIKPLKRLTTNIIGTLNLLIQFEM